MEDKICLYCNKTKSVSEFPKAGNRCKRCCADAEAERRSRADFVHPKITPEKSSWKNMKTRCNNPNYSEAHRYSEREITYCEEWDKFDNFLTDMGLKPSPDHSLERINNDGNYEPGNCKWATPKEQMLNNSRNRRIEYQDKNVTIEELSKITGINRATLTDRVNAGKKGDELTRPTKINPKYNYNGNLYSLNQLSRETGIDDATLYHRLNKMNLSVKEATISLPIRKRDK